MLVMVLDGTVHETFERGIIVGMMVIALVETFWNNNVWDPTVLSQNEITWVLKIPNIFRTITARSGVQRIKCYLVESNIV